MTQKLPKLRIKGKCGSNLKLVEGVMRDYHTTRASMEGIGRAHGVSAPTVKKIIDSRFYTLVERKADPEFGWQPRKATFFWNGNIKEVCSVVEGVTMTMDEMYMIFRAVR